MKAVVQVTVIRTLGGQFEGETLEEIVANAEMEARNRAHITSVRTVVSRVQKEDGAWITAGFHDQA